MDGVVTDLQYKSVPGISGCEAEGKFTLNGKKLRIFTNNEYGEDCLPFAAQSHVVLAVKQNKNYLTVEACYIKDKEKFINLGSGILLFLIFGLCGTLVLGFHLLSNISDLFNMDNLVWDYGKLFVYLFCWMSALLFLWSGFSGIYTERKAKEIVRRRLHRIEQIEKKSIPIERSNPLNKIA